MNSKLVIFQSPSIFHDFIVIIQLQQIKAHSLSYTILFSCRSFIDANESIDLAILLVLATVASILETKQKV